MMFDFFKNKKKEHYYSLKILEVVTETTEAVTIIFEQPKLKINYKSGQFITFIIIINGKIIRRSYSLSSSPYIDKNLSVTIKRVEGGLMSNYLIDTAKAGDIIKVMKPMGQFTTKLNKHNNRHIIMFGGGSGITPLISHINSILFKEPKSIVSLLYANKNINSIIFKEALKHLEIKYKSRFTVVHILDNAPLDWEGKSGLLDHTMLVSLFESIPNWDIKQTTYIMCGPEEMMNNVKKLLVQQKIPEKKIFKESFIGVAINKKEVKNRSTDSKEQVVTIVYEEEEHQVNVDAHTTILDAALNLEIDLPYSCQSGVCTACRGKCISGNVKMDEDEGLSADEIKAGYVLLCVSHPLSDDVKIEIG